MAVAGEGAAEIGPRPCGGRKGGGARTVILSVLLVAAFGCLLWVYTATGVLNVREVEVSGNRRLDGSYLRVLSGITPETHLLKMDVKAVERALLTEPYVEEVRVSRRFPATVLLTVREREPAGFVRQNGRCVLVAGDGTVLESLEQAPTGLAEIRASGLPLLVPGEKVDAEDLLRVASLLLSLDPELGGMVSAAGCSNGALYLEACGTRVFYGDLSELERKNSIACLALGELAGRYGSLEYIDVSFPDRPVVKPVSMDGTQPVATP
ncbi:MAG: FtsQ-type POTRA domain-containing protein [Actinobacteria bacterium]|nr:FtsQ-type POTRA domain-containing protein [Actinomycetota bacterium]